MKPNPGFSSPPNPPAGLGDLTALPLEARMAIAARFLAETFPGHGVVYLLAIHDRIEGQPDISIGSTVPKDLIAPFLLKAASMIIQGKADLVDQPKKAE